MKKLLMPLLIMAVLGSLIYVSSRTAILRSETPLRISPVSRALVRVTQSPLVRPWLTGATELVLDGGAVQRRIASQITKRLAGAVRLQVVDEDGFSRLIFPHTANGSGGGLIIRSSVLIINSTGSNAEGTIVIRRQDGTDFVLQTSLGLGSRFDFELGPGEVLRLETDGSGPQQVGWIEVTSNVPLSGSGVFTVSTASGVFLSEVGIGDSRRSNRAMLFVDLTDGKNTGYGISNTNAGVDLTFSVDLKRLDGTLVASRDVPLKAFNQIAEFVTDRFAGEDLEDFKGVLIIRSPDAPVAVTTLRTRGVNFTSFQTGDEVTDFSDEGLLVLARIGDGVFGNLLFQTSIILMNNSERDASATVSLFDETGSPLTLRLGAPRDSTFEVSIPAGTAVELSSDGSTQPGAVGWASIVSDIEISGGAAFTIRKVGSGDFVSEVGVNASDLKSQLNYVAWVEGNIDTGIGITNPFQSPVSVRLRLLTDSSRDASLSPSFRQAGRNTPTSLVAEKVVTLGSLSHVGLFLTQIFPGVPAIQQRSFQGRVEARLEEPGLTDLVELPLAGLTLLSRIIGSDVFLTSLPAPGTADIFGPEFTVDLGTELEGSQPSVCLNVQQRSEEVPMQTGSIEIEGMTFGFDSLVEGAEVGSVTVKMAGALAVGVLSVSALADGSADLNTLLTFDGQGDYTPFIGTVRNLPQGGVRFEIDVNPTEFTFLPIRGTTTLCFASGVLQIPAGGPATLTLRESAESFEALDLMVTEAVTVKRDQTTEIQTATGSPGAPRIDGVLPLRPVPGGEVVIHGSGFSSSASANAVTVEGNSRVAATVLSATPNELTILLPESARSGDLMVGVEGQQSNPYQLDFMFSPALEIEWGSLIAGAETPMRLAITQLVNEINFYRVQLQPDAGEWILDGRSPGSVIGTTRTEFRTSGREEIFLDGDGELVVSESTGQELTINAVPNGDDDPAFVIRIRSSGEIVIELPELDLTTYSLFDTLFEFTFTEPIFRMPGGGNFNITMTLTSLPERTAIEDTSIVFERNALFSTN